MALNFTPGHLAPASWQATGAGAPTLLGIQEYSLDVIAGMIDVSGTNTGGIRARIGGLTDCNGTVGAILDLDQPIYLNAPLIVSGVGGIALFYLNPQRAIQMPMIIEKVHYTSKMDDAVKYAFDGRANFRAGFVIYPPL